MLIPLTRKTLEILIPAVATGPQYNYYWGKPSDLLQRLLVSVVGVFVAFLVGLLIPDWQWFAIVQLLVGIIIGLYWLWGPVLWASRRNLECRKYPYAGFWQGRVVDIYISEELIGQEENVNQRGELVIVENRERCLNLEVGDRTGFITRIQVPLKRNYQAIAEGDGAQMVVLSHRGDLGRITQTTDVYIPDHNLWVSNYPYLNREAFIEVGRRLQSQLEVEAEEMPRSAPRRSSRYPEQPFPPRRALAPSQPSRKSARRPSRRTPRTE